MGYRPLKTVYTKTVYSYKKLESLIPSIVLQEKELSTQKEGYPEILVDKRTFTATYYYVFYANNTALEILLH